MSEQSIFLTAIELDSPSAAYLSKACANDERLRRRGQRTRDGARTSRDVSQQARDRTDRREGPIQETQNTLTVSADGSAPTKTRERRLRVSRKCMSTIRCRSCSRPRERVRSAGSIITKCSRRSALADSARFSKCSTIGCIASSR